MLLAMTGELDCVGAHASRNDGAVNASSLEDLDFKIDPRRIVSR